MAILRTRDVEFDIIEYLKQPLSRDDLERVLDLLPTDPADLVRKDRNFKAMGLNETDYVTRNAVIDLLLAHPKLMQRPVVIKGEQAILARPSEKINELLD